MKKERTTDLHAKVIELQTYDYFPTPGKQPIPTKESEVTFQLSDDSTITFTCSYFDTQILQLGDEGPLTYEGHTIISFADKIKE